MKSISILALVATFATACSKDESKSESLNLPALKPPVQRNTPAGMQSGSALALTAETSLQTMGSRLFTNGPTSIMERLAAVDLRMKEFATKTHEDGSPVTCAAETPREWTLPAALPGGATFPMYLQCSKAFDGPSADVKFNIGFGVKDDYAYLVEIQTSSGTATSPAVATVARAKLDGTATEAWITMQKFDNSQTKGANDYFFLGIKADDASKAFEVTVSGDGKGIGLDCGVRVKSDGTNVYGAGIFKSHGDSGTEDCTGNVTKSVTVCADAAALTAADAAKCAALTTFTLPAITYASMATANGKAASDAFIAATLSAYTVYQ